VELSTEILLMLAAVGLLAGFVDSIAGGGGLFAMPALLLTGITPVQALATNKFQSIFGTFMASRHFIRQKAVDLKRMPLMIVCVLIAATAGSIIVQFMDSSFLTWLMPSVLILVAVYTYFSKGLGHADTKAMLSDKAYSVTAAPIVGFYDGFFGPGTGSFFAMSAVKFLGMDFVRATATAKVLNFSTNVAAVTVFLLAGKVVFIAGIVMAAGQLIGARLGAGMVIKQGTGFVRIFTMVACVVMSVGLFLKNF